MTNSIDRTIYHGTITLSNGGTQDGIFVSYEWLKDVQRETDKLNRMRTHCEYCGGDFMATGIESCCPCQLLIAIKRAASLIHRNYVFDALDLLNFVLTKFPNDKVNL